MIGGVVFFVLVGGIIVLVVLKRRREAASVPLASPQPAVTPAIRKFCFKRAKVFEKYKYFKSKSLKI